MEKWTLSNLPPEGHADVGRWFWDNCYMASEDEKERLNLKERWLENYRIWRGGSVTTKMHKKHSVSANLIHANVQRTVANLTAKNPAAEVVSLDGGYEVDQSGNPIVDQQTGEPIPDQTDKKVTVRMKDWWNTTEQINVLVDSALQMEIYGPTIEKAVFNPKSNDADIVVIDPFSLIIAPGNWKEINDAPYCGMAQAIRPDAVETMFGLEPETVTASDVYSLLGEDREEQRPKLNAVSGVSSMYGAKTMHQRQGRSGYEDLALVVELFVRDNSMIESPVIDETTGMPAVEIDESTGIETPITQQLKKYPGGIRAITITNEGNLVLMDVPNPNVNPELTREQQATTYLFDHFPYYSAVSYLDTTSFWGFAAAEQVGDLAAKIAEILSRMYRYLARVTSPILIIPQDCMIDESEVDNKPGLILTPISSQASTGIRYLDVPSLPADTVRLFDMLMGVFDRVYQIEDADRGDTPNRVVAASAIVALQERNQILMRHKIRAVDYLIRQRGRCALSFFQNFGVTTDPIKVDEKVTGLRGLDLIGRKFQYVVESGSTITQTSLQVQEQLLDLKKMGVVDNQAVLEGLNIPNWRRIVERMAESGTALDQAAQVFIQAGIPQETIMQLIEYAKQPQTGMR